MPVASRASSFALRSVSSPTTTGVPPVASMPSTTASQSYVSSSRMPWATLCGSSSHGHMNSDAVAGRVGDRVGVAAARLDEVVGALQRPRAAGLHRVDARRRVDGAERDRLGEAVDACARERAAADLHDEPRRSGRSSAASS